MCGNYSNLSSRSSLSMKAATLACSRSHMEVITAQVGMTFIDWCPKLNGEGFAYYFEEQNAAIKKKELHAEEINLVALGINNGYVNCFLDHFQSLDWLI